MVMKDCLKEKKLYSFPGKFHFFICFRVALQPERPIIAISLFILNEIYFELTNDEIPLI
jgi:hypothetical protein